MTFCTPRMSARRHSGVIAPRPLGMELHPLALPLVVWARVSPDAHTLVQALAGTGIGAAFALLFLT